MINEVKGYYEKEEISIILIIKYIDDSEKALFYYNGMYVTSSFTRPNFSAKDTIAILKLDGNFEILDINDIEDIKEFDDIDSFVMPIVHNAIN